MKDLIEHLKNIEKQKIYAKIHRKQSAAPTLPPQRERKAKATATRTG
jgi:hypothetical protein